MRLVATIISALSVTWLLFYTRVGVGDILSDDGEWWVKFLFVAASACFILSHYGRHAANEFANVLQWVSRLSGRLAGFFRWLSEWIGQILEAGYEPKPDPRRVENKPASPLVSDRLGTVPSVLAIVVLAVSAIAGTLYFTFIFGAVAPEPKIPLAGLEPIAEKPAALPPIPPPPDTFADRYTFGLPIGGPIVELVPMPHSRPRPIPRAVRKKAPLNILNPDIR